MTIQKAAHMNMQERMEERLWDFIDGLGEPSERSEIGGLIHANREWRLKYQELLGVHQSMAGVEPEVPSMRFTKNVMEEIARHQIAPATRSYINKHIIRGIAACHLLPMAVAIVYALSQFGGTAPHSASPIPSYGLGLQSHLEKIDWGRIFSNNFVNVFLMINLVLGLMLLDMYLGRKKRINL